MFEDFRERKIRWLDTVWAYKPKARVTILRMATELRAHLPTLKGNQQAANTALVAVKTPGNNQLKEVAPGVDGSPRSWKPLLILTKKRWTRTGPPL